ncbi:LytR/AlgR family response regulator transcription factor [Poritiphilus flavus]|uniref:Response regulator n=1 Tax=Poritiphilus flavus TaxID=2697053 RepID=A0A6L9E8P2_9FLAO|nr:LytTR family DNA-binding domain-containing protein [Poritiphilus flavus]NAS11147.1 response regulator [Poritiphilus flavus]
MIRCAVIDDEPLARECLVNYIQKIDFLDLVGEGPDPTALLNIANRQTLDLVFLDIQMPIMTGIEYLKSTKVRPMVILTTAYPSYALQGFELDVLDYMVKPITMERFLKGANKAKDYLLLAKGDNNANKSGAPPEYFFVKCESVYEKIFFDEVEYVQALQNYVVIYTSGSKYVTLMSMKRIESLLGASQFIRVHKSYLVALDKIQSVENTRLHLTSATIPLSRNYKINVFEHVLNKSFLKK